MKSVTEAQFYLSRCTLIMLKMELSVLLQAPELFEIFLYIHSILFL